MAKKEIKSYDKSVLKNIIDMFLDNFVEFEDITERLGVIAKSEDIVSKNSNCYNYSLWYLTQWIAEHNEFALCCDGVLQASRPTTLRELLARAYLLSLEEIAEKLTEAILRVMKYEDED